MGESETAIAILETKVSALERQVNAIQVDVQAKFDRLEAKLDDALRGRPSWFVVFLISGLLTVASSLAVFELTH